MTRGPVVILTCDPALLHKFWLTEYAPEVIATEWRLYPSIDALADGLGGAVTADSVPIPLDCSDGFNEAVYGRPEQLLVPEARQACSAWSFVDAALAQRYTDNLTGDLRSGIWDEHHGWLRNQSFFDGSLVLVLGTEN